MEKLKLLYSIGMTSFIHQLSTAGLKDGNNVFTSDEEVEPTKMQFPSELKNETRQRICDIEGIDFESCMDARMSVFSGRRRQSFQSSRIGAGSRMTKIIRDDNSSDGLQH